MHNGAGSALQWNVMSILGWLMGFEWRRVAKTEMSDVLDKWVAFCQTKPQILGPYWATNLALFWAPNLALFWS
jgi:hypothetical protein